MSDMKMKDDVPEECNNADNDSDVDTSTQLPSAIPSETEDETDHRIVHSDPFHCDVAKRQMLISRIGTMMANERKAFMMEPLPAGVWLECYVDRIKLGFSRFSRKFSFHVDSGSDLFLAVGVKRRRNCTANYIISTDPNITSDADRDAMCTVGKLRSNFLGSEFMAYDTGLNPKRLKEARTANGTDLRHQAREELVALQYEHAMLGKPTNLPRRICVVLPHVKETSDGPERVVCKPLAPQVDGLTALVDHWSQATVAEGKQPVVRTYTNKVPVWSSRLKSFVLNFNNRVKNASVKNFQLVASDDANDIVLQFGRSQDKNRFHLDFRYPLSPFQAFSIAITAMDYKLCSE